MPPQLEYYDVPSKSISLFWLPVKLIGCLFLSSFLISREQISRGEIELCMDFRIVKGFFNTFDPASFDSILATVFKETTPDNQETICTFLFIVKIHIT